MAAVVGVSLRRRFPATALGGACLQVSSGVAERGQACRSRRRPEAEGAVEEAEGVQVKASGRERTATRCAVLCLACSIPVVFLLRL